MRINSLCLILWLTGLLCGQSPGPVRAVFLGQDVAHGFDHAGATPDLLSLLREHVRLQHPSIYVPLDLAKLRQDKVESLHIFHKRYCPPIGRSLGANLFIMARLVMVGPSPDNDFLYDVEAKAYSSSTDREYTFLRAKGVAGPRLRLLLAGKEEVLWQAILAGTGPK